MILLAHAGRGQVIIFIGLFALLLALAFRNYRQVLQKGMSNSLLVAIIFLCGVVFLAFGNPFFSSLSYLKHGPGEFIAVFVEKCDASIEGGDWYRTMFSATSIYVYSANIASNGVMDGEISPIYYWDYLYGVAEVVPGLDRVIPTHRFIGVGRMNQIAIHGDYVGVTGAPPGWVAAGLYHLGYLGVIINGLLYGAVMGWANRVLGSRLGGSRILDAIYIYVGIVVTDQLFHGIPVKFIRDQFVQVVWVIVFCKFFFSAYAHSWGSFHTQRSRNFKPGLLPPG